MFIIYLFICVIGAGYSSVVECLLMVWWDFGSVRLGGLIEYFSFQPVLHNWCSNFCLWDRALYTQNDMFNTVGS